jgi:2-polyprenyl-3-methyl-5-hydroxy-6-metoxy-1,4-benzoquinol methylase
MIPSMATRSRLPELMDAPDCSEDQLLRTVRQFASINRLFSRYRTVFKRWVIADMLREPGREYHLLDMGAGGCDIAVWMLSAARRLGLNLRVTACDADPRIVRYARATHGATAGLTVLERDARKGSTEGVFDYLFANHFLHHLADDEIVNLIRRWAPRVRRRMVFGDLRRSLVAYLGFSLVSHVYRGSFVREDGLISIRRGFVSSELENFAESALPVKRSTVYQLRPGRLVLVVDTEAGLTSEEEA